MKVDGFVPKESGMINMKCDLSELEQKIEIDLVLSTSTVHVHGLVLNSLGRPHSGLKLKIKTVPETEEAEAETDKAGMWSINFQMKMEQKYQIEVAYKTELEGSQKAEQSFTTLKQAR